MRSLWRRDFAFFWAIPGLVWQIIFLCVPVALVVYTSLHSDAATVTWYTLTLDHYRAIMTLNHVVVMVRSFFFAFTTATICLFVGYPVAYFIALRAGKRKMILLFLLTLPFWTNFLTQAYAWFFVLERHGLLNMMLKKLHIINEPLSLAYNSFAVLCVMVYCYLPFMIMPLYSVLQKIDIRLLEASQDLGATRWQTFKQVTLRLSYTGIQTGFLLVCIPAFGEFVIPMIMGGSRNFYVGSLITHYMLISGNEHLGAALTCVSSVLLFGVISFVLWYVNTRKKAS